MNRSIVRYATLQQLARLHWRTALAVGFAMPFVAVALWLAVLPGLRALLVVLEYWGKPPWHRAQLDELGSYVIPLLTAALTRASAVWVARRAGVLALHHGLLVGAVAAVATLLLWTAYHGSPGLWSIVVPALALTAGWLGGNAAQAAQASQDSLYNASRAIAGAHSPAEVAAVIGTHLAHSAGHRIALWQVAAWTEDGLPDEVILLATWPESSSDVWQAARQLRLGDAAIVSRMRRDSAPAFEVSTLPMPARAQWEALQIKAVRLIPLVGGDARCTDVMMVLADKIGSLRRGLAGNCRAFAAQTALALDHIRLLEQGRQLGMLAERQRLAREFHDSIKQQVFAVGMQIGAAQALLHRDPEVASERLAQADALVRQVQIELAAAIQALRPLWLDGQGLALVLRQYATGWARQNDMDIDIAVESLDDRILSLDAEQALLRITQEALSNVARHSAASRVRIELRLHDGTVQLSVNDNGRGFAEASALHAGYGLLSMRERATAVGGRLSISSTPGQGTQLICCLAVQGWG